jgi:hypothetical protein
MRFTKGEIMIKNFNSIITIEVGSTYILDAKKILNKHTWILKDISLYYEANYTDDDAVNEMTADPNISFREYMNKREQSTGYNEFIFNSPNREKFSEILKEFCENDIPVRFMQYDESCYPKISGPAISSDKSKESIEEALKKEKAKHPELWSREEVI